jgi:malate permease and related proteins
MIVLGFIASKYLAVQKESIGKLLIYILAPVVIFYGTYTAPLQIVYFSLPIVFYVICSLIAVIFYALGARIYGTDTTKNILAFTAGTGNTGYF